MSTAGAQRALVGTRVARGGGFAGTGQLLRLAQRRDRVVGTVWVLGLFTFSQGASIISLYPDPGRPGPAGQDGRGHRGQPGGGRPPGPGR
jgi:hypothetical protein